MYKLKDIVAKDPTIEAVHAVARAEVLYGKSPLATFKNLCKIVTDIQKRLGVTPKHAGMQGIHLRSKTSYYSCLVVVSKVPFQMKTVELIIPL